MGGYFGGGAFPRGSEQLKNQILWMRIDGYIYIGILVFLLIVGVYLTRALIECESVELGTYIFK